MNHDRKMCYDCVAREICPVYVEELTPECVEIKREHQRMRINTMPPEHNNVEHPSHYNQGSIECIDAMEEATKELKGAEAVLTSNVIRYIWRWKFKNGVEDLKKARWYLNRLIKKLEDAQ